MKKDQKLTRLGPHIKLLRRQIQEWNALLVQQSQVRFFTREHDGQRVKYYPKDRLAIVQQITDQALRLAELMTRQSAERQQMKNRHQQEELALKQAVDNHTSN